MRAHVCGAEDKQSANNSCRCWKYQTETSWFPDTLHGSAGTIYSTKRHIPSSLSFVSMIKHPPYRLPVAPPLPFCSLSGSHLRSLSHLCHHLPEISCRSFVTSTTLPAACRGAAVISLWLLWTGGIADIRSPIASSIKRNLFQDVPVVLHPACAADSSIPSPMEGRQRIHPNCVIPSTFPNTPIIHIVASQKGNGSNVVTYCDLLIFPPQKN